MIIPGRGLAQNAANSFFAWGWLLFAILPSAQVVGRGVFNIIAAVYLLWGLISILVHRPNLSRSALVLYAMLLVAISLSAAQAHNPAKTIDRLRDFVLYSLACWPVVAAVRNHSDLHRLINATGIFGIAALAFLYVSYLSRMNAPGFVPEQMMHEDNLPLLLPFILTFLQQQLVSARPRVLASLAVTTLIAAYVILSNGRAALLGLIAGLAVYGLLAMAARKRIIFVLIAAILLATMAVRGTYLLRGATTQPDLSSALNTASNFRLELWHNAIQHPPENPWLGAGMGNIPDVVLTVHGAQAANLKHLHNFLLDCWYENGIIGVGILLTILLAGFGRALRAWRTASPDERRQLGTLIAASAAIVVAALFSFSYASKQFALYLFAFLGMAALIPTNGTKLADGQTRR